MTDLRKAAEMALEALESWQKTCLDCGRASDELGKATAPIQALRQALAQPETTVENNSQNWEGMDGAVAWHLIDRHADNWADVGKMMDEWLKANQALAQPEQEPVDVVKVEHARLVELAKMYERGWNAALAKRKPVAWMYVNDDGECEQIEYGEPFDDPSVTPLYTTPPKREWVGITKEDKKEILEMTQPDERGYVIAITEAKLKEKNT